MIDKKDTILSTSPFIPRIAPKSLIIIGNGFDLKLKYKTSFKDFIEAIEKYPKYIGNVFVSHFLTLKNRPDYLKENWSDIENELAVIFADENPFLAHYHKIKQRFYFLFQPFKTYEDWLREEFFNFEKYLVDYLISLKINNDDKSQAYDLLYSICSKDNIGLILDFNYTPLLSKFEKNTIHVHGSLNNKNIIVGFDEFDLKKSINSLSPLSKQFTKTFRKFDIYSLGQSSLPRDIKKIIFYGHSLSGNDFSYFQSIFDFYNIYDSDVVLDFVYSVIKGHLKEEDKLSAKERVYALIKKYGESFDNIVHGRNLLHKLLLEGRIGVRDLNE